MKDKKTVAEIIDLLKKYKKELKMRYEVKRVGVFGSYIKGKAKDE